MVDFKAEYKDIERMRGAITATKSEHLKRDYEKAINRKMRRIKEAKQWLKQGNK